jgi:hypothetical protein
MTTVTVAVEAGRYAGLLVPSGSGNPDSIFTIHGSDGTVIGPCTLYRYTRILVNGPTIGGNKAVDVITMYPATEGLQITDPSGSAEF